MKKSDIFEIAVKILGLYLFYESIGEIKELLTNLSWILQRVENHNLYSEYSYTLILIASIVNCVLVLTFAVFLTCNTKGIVRKLCKSNDFDEKLEISASKKGIYEVILVLLGLILVVWSIPDFTFRLINHIKLVQNDFQINDYNVYFVIVTGIRIALGLIIIAFAKSFALLFSGRYKKSNKEIKNE